MSTVKRRQSKTPEQRQEETAALRERQEAAVIALVHSDQWTNYLNSMKHLRNYSLNNMLLILMQMPEATTVAGFNTWKTLGRKITSGPGSSLKIWGKPYHPKLWVPKGTEGSSRVYEEKDGQVKVDAHFTRCPILSVFDISQTEGDPLPSVFTDLADGDDTSNHEHIIDVLTSWLTSQRWTISSEDLAGGTKGVTRHLDRSIVLNSSNSVAQNVKTLIHESAHALLHGDDTYATVSEYGASDVHRGAAEVQAESVAYVVAGMLGLDTSTYSTGYVAGWASAAAQGSEDEALVGVLRQSAGAVKVAVDAIMDGFESESMAREAAALDCAGALVG